MKSVQLSLQGVSKFSFHWMIFGRTIINPHGLCQAPMSSDNLRKFLGTSHPTSACCRLLQLSWKHLGLAITRAQVQFCMCVWSPKQNLASTEDDRSFAPGKSLQIHNRLLFFPLFLLLKSWDKTLLHPCSREENRLGTYTLPLPELLFGTSLAHHRSFSRQHLWVHNSRETNQRTSILSTKSFWIGCEMVPSLMLQWWAALLVHKYHCLFTDDYLLLLLLIPSWNFPCLIPLLAWLLQFGKLSTEMLC